MDANNKVNTDFPIMQGAGGTCDTIPPLTPSAYICSYYFILRLHISLVHGRHHLCHQAARRVGSSQPQPLWLDARETNGKFSRTYRCESVLQTKWISRRGVVLAAKLSLLMGWNEMETFQPDWNRFSNSKQALSHSDNSFRQDDHLNPCDWDEVLPVT